MPRPREWTPLPDLTPHLLFFSQWPEQQQVLHHPAARVQCRRLIQDLDPLGPRRVSNIHSTKKQKIKEKPIFTALFNFSFLIFYLFVFQCPEQG
jgi:hypothetical protein